MERMSNTTARRIQPITEDERWARIRELRNRRTQLRAMLAPIEAELDWLEACIPPTSLHEWADAQIPGRSGQ